MDFIIDLIVFVIRALFNQADRKKAAPTPGQLGSALPAAGRQAQAPALAPRTTIAQQDAVDDGERLRSVLTLIGVIVLVIMAVAWFLYMHGSL